MLKNSQINYGLTYNSICVILATIILCIATIRNGKTEFAVNIWLTVFLVDILSLCVAFNTKKMKISIYNLILVAVTFALTFVQKFVISGYYSFGSALSGALLFSFFVLSIGLVVQENYEFTILKTINFFNMVSASIIIFQVSLIWMNIRLDKIPVISEIFFNAWDFGSVLRPCGLFFEPSHLAEMMLISIFYYLFIEKNNARIILLGLSIFLSTSSLGIIGFALLLAMRYVEFERVKAFSKGIKFIFIIFGGFVVFLIMFWLQKSGNSNWLLDRMLKGGSFSVRVMRSLEIFGGMDWSKKLIGLGIQNQEKYLNYYGIILPSDTYETSVTNREYAQTMGYILCSMGLVGFGAFVTPLFKLFSKNSKRIKCFILLFAFICIFCCVFSRSIFFMYFIVLYAIVGIEDRSLTKFDAVHTSIDGGI